MGVIQPMVFATSVRKFVRSLYQPRKRSRRSGSPQIRTIEMLEDRLLLTVRYWDGGGGQENYWGTAANWDNDQPLDFTQPLELVFDVSTPTEIVKDIPNGMVESITFTGAGDVTLRGYSITFQSPGTVAPRIISLAGDNTILNDIILASSITAAENNHEFIVGGGSTLRIVGAVDGYSAGMVNLTLSGDPSTGNGKIIFGNLSGQMESPGVGYNSALASLIANISVEIDARAQNFLYHQESIGHATVTTTGAQIYNAPLTLASSTVLLAGTDLVFNSTIDASSATLDPFYLQLVSHGATWFSAPVGGVTPLDYLYVGLIPSGNSGYQSASLTVLNVDPSLVAITTEGDQFYYDPILVNQNDILDAGTSDVTILRTVDSWDASTANYGGYHAIAIIAGTANIGSYGQYQGQDNWGAFGMLGGVYIFADMTNMKIVYGSTSVPSITTLQSQSYGDITLWVDTYIVSGATVTTGNVYISPPGPAPHPHIWSVVQNAFGSPMLSPNDEAEALAASLNEAFRDEELFEWQLA